jgi:hypothetical protein
MRHGPRDPEPEVRAARVWAACAFRGLAGEPAPLPDAPLPVARLSGLGLGPLLYRALSLAGDERASLFVAEFRHATTANLLRMGHARRLADRLAAEGVGAVLLKGAATLVRFGGEPGVRPMADLDLLVAPADVPRASAVLRAGGLTERDRYPSSGGRSHSMSFVGQAGPLAFDVDLHRGVAPWPVAAALARAILASPDEVSGWRIPGIVDAVCVAALHRASQGFVGGCLDLVDLRRLTGLLDEDGWARLLATSRRFGIEGAVYASLRQASWWLGAGSPVAVGGLAALGGALGAARRALLHGLAPVDAPIRSRPVLNGPLGRNLLVVPSATRGLPALVAAARLMPFRVADEWRRHRAGDGVGRATGRVLAQVAFGAAPAETEPPGARRPA